MKDNKWLGISIAGICAGAVNGLFGAAGGMVLIPLLTALTQIDEDALFPSSISIILPICLVSLTYSLFHASIDFRSALPYLIGSSFGGIAAGLWGQKIPTLWLHKGLGILILWGGIRYLWQTALLFP